MRTRLRRVAAGAWIAVIGTAAPSAAGALEFALRKLPALAIPNTSSTPTDVSDDGRVVVGSVHQLPCIPGGSCFLTDREAARWESGTLELLGYFPNEVSYPESGATAVTADGEVAFGWSDVGGVGPAAIDGFRWEAGALTALGSDAGPIDASADGSTLLFEDRVVRNGIETSLPDGFRAKALAADGDPIAGAWIGATGWEAALIADGQLVVLAIPLGADAGSRAIAVSDDGSRVAGIAYGNASRWAVVWRNGIPETIPMPPSHGLPPFLPPDPWTRAEVVAISATGDRILGNVYNAEGRYSGVFLWDEANGSRLLEDVVAFDFNAGSDAGLSIRMGTAMARSGAAIVGHGAGHRGWVLTLPEACVDGLDNDRDGLVDAADPGCDGASDYTERGPALPCDDGIDQDGDWRADFPDDASCPDPYFPVEGQCNDGVDSDGDGLVDELDPGCESPVDPWETSPLLPCDDGIDNDGDGLIDYRPNPWDPGDPSCGDVFGFSETTECSDGIDNDGDGWIDGSPWLRGDPECAGRPWHWSESTARSCGLGAELALVLSLFGVRRTRRAAARSAARRHLGYTGHLR